MLSSMFLSKYASCIRLPSSMTFHSKDWSQRMDISWPWNPAYESSYIHATYFPFSRNFNAFRVSLSPKTSLKYKSTQPFLKKVFLISAVVYWYVPKNFTKLFCPISCSMMVDSPKSIKIHFSKCGEYAMF